MTANAKTNRDCYEAIKTALWNLGGDHHSRFFTPEEAKYYENDDRSEIEMPVGRVIDGRIGYLTVPAFVSMSEVLMRKYVDSMHALIKRLDGEHITGWIVDVRNNTGGNTVPMLVGIGPVCGEGVMSGGTNLQESGFNLYKAGGLFEKDTCLYKKTDPYQLLHPDPYVAVLTGGQCASSGESVVLAFKNRAKAKSFGEPTAGLTTGTEGFVLTDGAILYLTVGVGIDRKGIVYHGPIKPDVAMKNDPDTMVDEVMEEAIKWLKLVNQ
jgi:C-terminal processing protease CtpA/Prc